MEMINRFFDIEKVLKLCDGVDSNRGDSALKSPKTSGSQR